MSYHSVSTKMSYSSMSTAYGYGNFQGSPGERDMGDGNGFPRRAEAKDFPYDRRDLKTRNWCIAGLIFSWIAGATIIGFGCWRAYLDHKRKKYDWTLPHLAAEVIPLAIDLLVTTLTLITGYIHTTSLRWALQEENRLQFNSNLRIFTFARKWGPNSWLANIILIVCYIFAYASSSLAFQHSVPTTSIKTMFSLEQDYVTVNAVSIIILGFCIIGFTAVSTWAISSTHIPSWSSCPLETAYAARRAGNIKHREHRCMRSVHDQREGPAPVYPRSRQKSAWKASAEVRWVLVIMWLLVLLCFMAAGLAHRLIGDLFPKLDHEWGSWALIPNEKSQSLPFSPPSSHPDSTGAAVTLIILFAVLQSPLTLGVHCAEVQVNFSRDEAFWRKATTRAGCRLEEYDSIIAANTSWQALILNLFKNLLHWAFGLGIKIVNRRLFIYPVPILYLAALSTLCAIFITFLSLRQPKGQQPAAFGHLQTLVDLVDDWSATLFWGHKHDEYQVCHAGTDNHPLPPLKNAPYW